jgi:hypothetical protein
MAKSMREVATTTLEVLVDDAIRTAMHRRGLRTVEQLKHALADDPYRVKIGRSYLNDIVNGDRWPKDDTMFAALLHLLGLKLENLGIDPDQRPAVWMTLQYAEEHGWRPRRTGGDPDGGLANGPFSEQVNETSCGKPRTPAHRMLVNARLSSCMTSQLPIIPAA